MVTLFGLAFLAIYLGVETNQQWIYFIAAGLWLTEGVLEFLYEKKKKAGANFIIYEKKKTAVNYLIVLGFLSVNYFYFSNQNTQSDSLISLVFFSTLVCWVIISRSGDAYYLFDNSGIKTLRRSWDYEQMTKFRITNEALEIDTRKATNEIVIKKDLLNDSILNYIKGRINLNEA